MKGRCIIGTSGWSYDHWQGVFYPHQLRATHRLSHYASHFDSVEINNTFYRLPTEETFLKWKGSVGKNFLFAIKVSRYITHMKKLKNAEIAINNFLERAKSLGQHLGPILFQLPPRWRYNGERLSSFVSLLDPSLKFVFEFRDNSWFNKDAYRILEKQGIALCLYQMPGMETPIIETAPFTYIRFHGTNHLYAGSYSDKEIRRWGETIRNFSDKGIDTFAYFNNDAVGNAVKDAGRLIEVVSGGKV